MPPLHQYQPLSATRQPPGNIVVICACLLTSHAKSSLALVERSSCAAGDQSGLINLKLQREGSLTSQRQLVHFYQPCSKTPNLPEAGHNPGLPHRHLTRVRKGKGEQPTTPLPNAGIGIDRSSEHQCFSCSDRRDSLPTGDPTPAMSKKPLFPLPLIPAVRLTLCIRAK